jgi:hypothetical protein
MAAESNREAADKAADRVAVICGARDVICAVGISVTRHA